ncbi:ArsR/SmtB family transcription factor [Paracoccus yeei]|uniref:ArsR/SmtB family transcription factor n=1 Tax=Paracoccus yeei TaxID=147645 RepID=UPI0028D0322E|nr:metalloregulator ArsR/SmtB family transcription factor [Paracoccus yeei]
MNLPPDLLSDLNAMAASAGRASGFLKGLANPQRLLVLCCLAQGERHVGALVQATGIGQTSMSQHLARLKAEAIVAVRRDHRTLYYRIAHPAVAEIMQVLYRHFCEGKSE